MESHRTFRKLPNGPAKLRNKGNPIGQLNLSAMIALGDGVQKNALESVKWATRAAEQGCTRPGASVTIAACAQARYLLGAAYFQGEGVPQDYVLAHMWINLAAATLPTGDDQKKAADLRNEIARQMTPQQIADAQQLAREWKPR